MLAIALNFCLVHAFGLGAIDATVRRRSCDCAFARRIGALSLTLSIHLFTSRRAESSQEAYARQRPHPIGRKPIKDRFGFDQFQKSPSATGVDDTTANESPCLTTFASDRNLPERQDSLVFGNREIATTPRMRSGTANARENERPVRFSKTWRREAPSCISQPHFIVETDAGQKSLLTRSEESKTCERISGISLYRFPFCSVFETSCSALQPVLDQIRPHELDYPSVVVAVC